MKIDYNKLPYKLQEELKKCARTYFVDAELEKQKEYYANLIELDKVRDGAYDILYLINNKMINRIVYYYDLYSYKVILKVINNYNEEEIDTLLFPYLFGESIDK